MCTPNPLNETLPAFTVYFCFRFDELPQNLRVLCLSFVPLAQCAKLCCVSALVRHLTHTNFRITRSFSWAPRRRAQHHGEAPLFSSESVAYVNKHCSPAHLKRVSLYCDGKTQKPSDDFKTFASKFRRLEVLRLHDYQSRQTFVSDVAKLLGNLRTLSLRQTPARHRDLITISENCSLHTLYLFHLRIDRDSITETLRMVLTNLPLLKSLGLSIKKEVVAAFQQLSAPLQNLNMLVLVEDRLTSYEHIAAKVPNIRCFILYSNFYCGQLRHFARHNIKKLMITTSQKKFLKRHPLLSFLADPKVFQDLECLRLYSKAEAKGRNYARKFLRGKRPNVAVSCKNFTYNCTHKHTTL